MSELVFFGLIFGAIMVGVQMERWRAAWSRSEWRQRQREKRGFKKPASRSTTVHQFEGGPLKIVAASEQLTIVSQARFERRQLLSRAESKVFFQLEKAVQQLGAGWRVMAQVCLGEILSSPQKEAFAAINSKRVDMLVICPRGFPIVAIEYQGEGHYQGSAAARDAVKKEALRKAGVRYFEVTPEHGPADIAGEISRIAKVERLKKAG